MKRFWDEKKKDFENERVLRKVPEFISSIKSDELKMKILIIEEKSLN